MMELSDYTYTPKLTMCIIEYFFRTIPTATIDSCVAYLWGSGYPGKRPPRFMIARKQSRVAHGKYDCSMLMMPLP
jgi:hypothetical protein